MKRLRTAGLIVGGLLVGGMVSVVHAADQPGTHPITPKAPLASTPSTSIPQITSITGSITELDLKAMSPSLTLTDAGGKVWTLALDPQLTSIWRNGQIGKLDALQVGQQVKVRYTSKAGKNVAKSITIAQAITPVATAPAPSMTPPIAPVAATPMATPVPAPTTSPASTEPKKSY